MRANLNEPLVAWSMSFVMWALVFVGSAALLTLCALAAGV